MFRFHQAHSIYFDRYFRTFQNDGLAVSDFPSQCNVGVKGPRINLETGAQEKLKKLRVNCFQFWETLTVWIGACPPKLLAAVGETAGAVKNDLKGKERYFPHELKKNRQLFFGGFTQKGQGKVDVFRPGEIPPQGLRAELLLHS